MKNFQNKILENVSRIEAGNPALAIELKNIRKDPEFKDQASKLASRLPASEGGLEKAGGNFALETIVLRVGRPVLAIYKDDAILEFKDPESLFWKEKLIAAESFITKAVKAIGRIELENDPVYDWVGTGWLVDTDVIITNRHVAKIFSQWSGKRFVFRQGRNDRLVSASVDFLEEANRQDEFTFTIEDVLHIERDSGPDLAFLKVRSAAEKELPQKILLATATPVNNQEIGVIGYPARDSRIPW